MRTTSKPLAGLLAAAPLLAGAAGTAPFGFLDPEVAKSSWQLRSLTACDVNSDGKTDAALLNNEKGRIDLYLQREPGVVLKDRPKTQVGRWDPVLEDSRFQLESVTTGQFMLNLAAGDLNGDKRVDLAVTTKGRGLLVYFQREDGRWDEPVKADLDKPSSSGESLVIHDIDRDGKPELLALTDAYLVFFKMGVGGKLQQSSRLALSAEGSFGLKVLDINGDKRDDLLLIAPSDQFALRARLQAKDGTFGPEMVVRYDMPSGYISELRRDENGAPVFVSVQRRSGQIEVFSLRPATGGESLLPHALEAYSVPVKSTARALQYARGDFDGDGRGDVAAVDFAGAQIFLYLQEPDGQLGAPRGFPTLADINSIAAADLDRDGRSELIVASATEETAGVSVYKDGKLSYPDPLPLKGKPLAVAAGDVDGDGNPDLVLAARVDSERTVTVFSGRKGALPGADGPSTNFVLKAATDDPAQVEVHDLDQDGKTDLLFLAPSKPLHAALQTGPLAFEEIKDLSGYSRGLVGKIDPRAFATADVNGDGKAEIILTRKGFVRAIRMTAEKQYEVVEQYNATSPESEITAAVFVPVPDQPRPLLLLADASAKRIDVMKPVEGGSYESAELIDLADPQVNGAWVASGKEGTAVFWVGKSGFWRMAVNARTGLEVNRLVTHETDIPDMKYSGVDAADMNADGVNDLVAFDSDVTRILEFLTVDPEWNIKSEMHFKVFEQDPGAGMRSSASPVEPKEGLLKDLTGDGKTDIFLYTHDRLLLYPQE